MNQAALITGGAKRIGKALAVNLARQGYDIALHYGCSFQEAQEVQKEIQNLKPYCENQNLF